MGPPFPFSSSINCLCSLLDFGLWKKKNSRIDVVYFYMLVCQNPSQNREPDVWSVCLLERMKCREKGKKIISKNIVIHILKDFPTTKIRWTFTFFFYFYGTIKINYNVIFLQIMRKSSNLVFEIISFPLPSTK